MEFLCYHRDRAGSLPLREKLLEDHWSYMDGFAAELIARGPTFTVPEDLPTGSVHIADLPDAAAARAFAFEEPGYQAGMYRDILLRRYVNHLGRTMWEFPGGLRGEDRHFVLGLGEGEPADLDLSARSGDLLAHGSLYSDDGTRWLGTAVLIREPDPEAARAILTAERYASIEVHPWECGGRR